MRSLEDTETGKGFIVGKVLWQPFYREYTNIGRKELHLRGPLCPECLTQMELESPDNQLKLKCINPKCNGKIIELTEELNQLSQNAHKIIEGKLREGIQIISLDLPPGIVKAENKNEDFWVEARIAQNKGKLMGLIYFGRITEGKQNKKDYAQVFLDFSSQQLRFDQSNMHPLQELNSIKAKFEQSSTEIVRDN